MWLSPCFPTFLFKSTSEVDVGSLMRAPVCCLSGALLRAHLFTCIYRGVAVLGPRGINTRSAMHQLHVSIWRTASFVCI